MLSNDLLHEIYQTEKGLRTNLLQYLPICSINIADVLKKGLRANLLQYLPIFGINIADVLKKSLYRAVILLSCDQIRSKKTYAKQLNELPS